MKIFAETKRFILREIIPGDAQGLFTLDSDPEVHRYLGNKPVQSMEKIEEMIGYIRQQYTDNGIGRWAIADKATHEFIGWAGLKLVKERTNNHMNYYDVGYRLIRKYWGQGIAFECAIASLDYGFDVMNLDKIYAAAHTENGPSNRVLQKCGMKLMETFNYDGSIHNWYALEKSGRMKKEAFL